MIKTGSLSSTTENMMSSNPDEDVIEHIKEIVVNTFIENEGLSSEKEFEENFFSFNSVILIDDAQVLVRLEDIFQHKRT